MELRHSVFQQQKQTLSVSQQVIQSVRLLQFDTAQLNDFLREQAERNPLIEILEPEVAPAPQGVNGSGPGAFPVPRGRAHVEDGAVSAVDLAAADGPSLHEHLHGQLRCLRLDAKVLATGAAIIDALEPDGYLRCDPEEFRAEQGVDAALFARALGVVQGLEPTGVGARTLSECLRLQLGAEAAPGTALHVLLGNLDLLARYDIKRLASRCGADPAEVMEMAQGLRALDPRPGLQFDLDPIRPAIPDVCVRHKGDGSFSIELNTEVLPRVLVDRRYHAEVSAGIDDASDRRHVAEFLRDANWLVRNMDQRAQTILQVATEIVTRQSGFFERGPAHLRPLFLKDIAEAIGVHESTVCRAVSQKYMMTPRGMYEMSFFFSGALGATGEDEGQSCDAVRHRIREMIEREAPERILSDQQIMDMLRDEGVDIARRTVAKYREALRIPTSRLRKRMKRAQGVQPARTSAGGEPQALLRIL